MRRPPGHALQTLKTKLERDAAQAEQGDLLDGDEVFEELRKLIADRKQTKKKAELAESD